MPHDAAPLLSSTIRMIRRVRYWLTLTGIKRNPLPRSRRARLSKAHRFLFRRCNRKILAGNIEIIYRSIYLEIACVLPMP